MLRKARQTGSSSLRAFGAPEPLGDAQNLRSNRAKEQEPPKR
jgi:hypothetical protein